MVVGAFPAAKLGALLLKQISKPIANAVKSQAKSSPFFRKYICMPPAQFYNWCEIKTKMWVLNLGKPVNIPVLNEAMAIELGANLLGEGVIFIIAAGILIFEYNRGAKKEAAKEEAKIQEINDIRTSIRDLFLQSEEQAAQLRELTRKLGDLETKLFSSHGQGPKRTPPPPPSQTTNKLEDPVAVPYDIITNVSIMEQNRQQPFTLSNVRRNSDEKAFLLRTLNEVQTEFWGYPNHREDGLLTLGLNHLYTNVFRINV